MGCLRWAGRAAPCRARPSQRRWTPGWTVRAIPGLESPVGYRAPPVTAIAASVAGHPRGECPNRGRLLCSYDLHIPFIPSDRQESTMKRRMRNTTLAVAAVLVMAAAATHADAPSAPGIGGKPA